MGNINGKANGVSLGIIPEPRQVIQGEGKYQFSECSTIGCIGGIDAESAAEMAARYLRPATGYGFKVEKGKEDADIVLISLNDAKTDRNGFVDESYSMAINTNGVRLTAACRAGLLHGIQTLRQCLPPANYSTNLVKGVDWSVPCVQIEDKPDMRWRGLHLDVSRHFFSVEEVCRFIELLAMHRFNRLHWHLTDDQGWRVEVEQYPRLTEVGSQRPYTLIGHESERPRRYDDVLYGGFYTKKELKEIVEFADERGISIMPEIDMPGHMQAAIAAYPGLGNTDMSLKPRCHWGISHHILNPKAETVQFIKNVLSEVLELFPNYYIHIGGDEAVKTEWSESRMAQERMRELGLNNEEELQSWFIAEMGAYLADNNRKLIGWDEIMQGGLPEGSAVMSWRNMEHGVEAAKMGHDIVMAPKQCTYFDYYQFSSTEREPLAIGGLTTLEDVYGFNPITEELPDDNRNNILGGQGQLWTEYIPDMECLEYRAYPRACALSEVLWKEDRGSFDHFKKRLQLHRRRMKELNCNLFGFDINQAL